MTDDEEFLIDAEEWALRQKVGDDGRAHVLDLLALLDRGPLAPQSARQS